MRFARLPPLLDTCTYSRWQFGFSLRALYTGYCTSHVAREVRAQDFLATIIKDFERPWFIPR